jgi:hypothetical protein
MPKGEVTRPSDKAIKRLQEIGYGVSAKLERDISQFDREQGNKNDKDEAARMKLAMEDAEAKRLLDELRKRRERERKR